MDSPSPIIGIDFGTTNSKMAWYNPKTNQAEIIMNAEGELQTPSVVYFGKDETLIGNPALEMLDYEEERERVILSIKRELTTTPFIALPGKSVKPVEVATEILRKLKRDAEERLFHRPVTRTVITYPASFGPLDRDKIREAAQSAGFDEIELLEEPVAAAIAYTQMGLKVGKYVLVYDLGGGTFDLAVLAREDNGSFRPALEPQGIKRCGGDDFDEALYNYCDQVAREQYGRPISLTRKRDLHFLKECRQRKENLAITKRRLFKSLLEPGAVLFEHEIERVTFESLISPTVEETVRKTKMLLEQASAERQAVDTVVLIGGSSRIPLVRRLLEEGLPLKPLQWEKQDIAVALGASYRAYSLWKPENQYRKAVELAGTDKKLDEIKITQLSTLANDLGLTEDQAADIEREVMGETKKVLVFKTRLLQVLRTFQSQNNRLYVSPNIPWNKFADARVKCNVPQSEEILGLIDCNSIGSATILFGTEGIYYFGLVFRDPGGIISNYQAVKIPYSELFLFPVRIDNKQVAAGNGKKIYLGESGVSREKLRDMLNAIKGFSD